MGWEHRERGGRYYYRKVRRGRRVVSEYVSTLIAPFLAEFVEEKRRLRALRRRCVLDEREALDGDAEEVRRWYDLVEMITNAALEAAGYHRHDRGEWRKRRMGAQTTGGLALAVPLPALPTDQDLEPLVAKARKGDGAALGTLLRVLQDDPERLIRLGARDLTEMAESSTLLRSLKDDLIARAAVAAQMDRMRGELAGTAPTPLERLLIDRIVLCWLQVQLFEIISTSEGKTLDGQLLMEKRRDSAHHRYLKAIKTLAQVRRLRPPTLQVNVALDGGRQVNTAGDLMPTR